MVIIIPIDVSELNFIIQGGRAIIIVALWLVLLMLLRRWRLPSRIAAGRVVVVRRARRWVFNGHPVKLCRIVTAVCHGIEHLGRAACCGGGVIGLLGDRDRLFVMTLREPGARSLECTRHAVSDQENRQLRQKIQSPGQTN